MEFYVYLWKSTAVLSLFFLVDFFLLKKETLFNQTRYFLLAGVICALVFPLIEFTQVTYIERTPNPFNFGDIPITNYNSEEPEPFNWWQLLFYVYMAGVMVMFVRFSVQIIGLMKILNKPKYKDTDGFYHIELHEKISPFSFFKYIAYYLKSYNREELDFIIQHEKIHGRQYHSIDVLLNQFLLIAFWFNPLAWKYQKRILENLEFIADHEVANESHLQQKNYELTLLKVSTNYEAPSLANQFYQSLIKKRIVMLNKKPSKKSLFFKSLIILPLLGFFLWSFNVNEEVEYKATSSQMVNEQKSIKITSQKNEIEINFNEYVNSINQLGYLEFNGNTYNLSDLEDRYFTVTSFCHYSDKNGVKKPTFQGDFITKDQYQNKFLALYVTRHGKLIYAEDQIKKLNKNSTNTSAYQQKDPLILIEGEEATQEEMNNLEPSHIKSMNILKGENATENYGEKGKNGVIEITLKTEEEIKNSTTHTNSKKSNTVEISKTKNSLTYKSDFPAPLYLIDGKKVEKEEVNELDPSTIKSINILEDENAIDKYGEEGKNGVVEISLLESKNQADDIWSISKGKNYGDGDYLFVVGNSLIEKEELDKIEADKIKNIRVYTSEDAKKILNIDAKGKKVMEFELYGKNEKDRLLPEDILKQKKYQDLIKNKNVLILVDGKETSRKQLQQLDQTKIKTVFSADGDTAVKKFGEKAKAGVIVINTK